jgi:PAS domain S-box-containing protein
MNAVERSADELRALLASVVDSSDDAIVTKTLQGVITSWNRGAERLFGYTVDEAVGQPIFLIIPDDRKAEEEDVLARLRRGERIDHFETVRLSKDGRQIPISLTVSPVKDGSGRIIGASKIARDISDRLRAEEMAAQQLLEQERLKQLTRLVLAQEDERRRIARELHDQLGQQLTALRLTLATLQSKSTDPRVLQTQIETLEALACQLDEDVSFRVWELTPTILENVGLPEALRAYADRWERHFGVPIQLHIPAAPGRLPPDVETMLYRLAQEALNNVIKHADASRVDIVLERKREHATLIVEDNGRGFDSSERAMNPKGLGLLGMKERAAILGAEFQIESAEGHGTSVVVRVPV